MSEGNSLSLIAMGTINPFRFVQDAPGIPFGALQCSGAGVPIIGIAQEWVSDMPGTPWQRQFVPQMYPATASGSPLRVYGEHDTNAMIMVASGYTVLPGMMLTADASGNAIPIVAPLTGSTKYWVGAKALEAGVAGDVIRCVVYENRQITA